MYDCIMILNLCVGNEEACLEEKRHRKSKVDTCATSDVTCKMLCVMCDTSS